MKQLSKIRFAGLLVFIFVVCIFYLAAQMESNRAIEAHKREVTDVLSVMNADIENIISSRIFLAQGIIAYIKVNPNLDENEVSDYASGLYDLQNDLIMSVTILKDTTIAYVFPLESNRSAIGKDLSLVEGQKDTVLKVKETGELILTGPVNLIQGGKGIIARIPVLIDTDTNGEKGYWGQVSLVMSYDKLVESAMIENIAEMLYLNIYEVNVADEDVHTVWSNFEGYIFDPVRSEIKNPNSKWLVEAAPKNGWNERTIIFYILISTGFIFGIVAAQYVSNLIRANEKLEIKVANRTEQLTETNVQLQESMSSLEEHQVQLIQVNDQLETSLIDLKETQDQLISSEKLAALGQLVAGVAHEINTPLGICITLATYIQEELNHFYQLYTNKDLTMGKIQEYLENSSEAVEMMVRNLEKSSDIVNGFKQVAIDQSTFEMRKFNFNNYIKEVVRNLTPKLKKTKHKIEITCDKSLIIRSYPGAISQILTNLIMNSLIHGFDDVTDGLIEINIKKENDVIIFIYRDNGVGIKDELHDKVFEPFYTTKKNQGSTGLGLHIIHNLVVQALEGTIVLESKGAQGVVFKICFEESKLETMV